MADRPAVDTADAGLGAPGDGPGPDWSGAVTFVPADPPRCSRFAVWSVDEARSGPGAPVGLFAEEPLAGAATEVLDVVLDGPPRLRRVPTRCDAVTLADALGPLAALAADAPSDSARFWGRVVRFAFDLIGRGRLLPSVTAGGWDAWRVDPLDPADHQVLASLAAACPPEAHALAATDQGTAVVDPAWLVRSAVDAVADRLVRTDAAADELGVAALASAEPVPAAPLAPWLTAAYGHLASPVRLGLRIETVDDPHGLGDAFEVVLQLRSASDPSLVVEVDDVLAGPGGPGDPVVGRLGADVERDVLLAVRRAAGSWPALDRVLESGPAGRPAGRLVISPDDADDLLDAIELLAAAGVEVLWPGLGVAELRHRVVATAAPGDVADAPPLVDLEHLLDFRWQLLLDDRPLDADELATLSEAKRHLVRLRGRWVRLDARMVERLRRPPELTGPGALAAALTGDFVDVDGTVVEVVADGVVATLRSRIARLGGAREQPEPAGLDATLRPYQRRGLAWLLDIARSDVGGVLADDMGLGKTLQVIALHLALAEAGDGGPTLVVCPTSVIGNWEREIRRFAPGMAVRRLAASGAAPDPVPADEILLITYGGLRRRAEGLAEVGWRLVVADEAQHVKNPNSHTARALRRLPARTRLALTGTPVENRLSELWALFDWTVPGLLGGRQQFREAYAIPIERHHDPRASDLLVTLTRPFMLRRRKTDPGVAEDLPPRTHHDVVVPLTDEQLSLYQALVSESLAAIRGTDGIDRSGLVFRLLGGLKQIANHPAQYLHETDGPLAGRSGKLDAAAELIRSAVDGDEQVLVFSQYVRMCELVHRRLGEVEVDAAVLHGSLTSTARDELVRRFQSGELPVLIVSLKAGGTGLNLTAATQVVHVDRWWNPAVEDQATDRAWRIGQTRPVVVHRLISEGTIDERIAEMIDRKRKLADRVVGGGGEAWIAELDDEQLERLVTLRGGPAGESMGRLVDYLHARRAERDALAERGES